LRRHVSVREHHGSDILVSPVGVESKATLDRLDICDLGPAAST
jgi:hypothetical protein